MSSFSRGVSGFINPNCFRLPPSIRVVLLPNEAQYLNSSLQKQCFSSFSRLKQHASSKAAPKSHASQPAYRTRGGRVPSSRYPSSNPIIRLVEATGKPILLYKAPNRGMFTLATYVAAGMLIGGGCWTMNHMYLHLPKEQPNWVRVTYGFMAIGLVCLGMYCVTAPVHRLLSIEAFPGVAGGPVKLRFEGKWVDLPFIKPTIMMVKPVNTKLPYKIRPVAQTFRDISLINRQDITYDLENKSAVVRPLVIAVRYLSRGLFRWFVNTRIIFTRFGIIYVDVDGGIWKLDATGWLLDDGKGLDSVITN